MGTEAHERNLSAKYAMLQGNYWMIYCSVFGYVSVFLLEKNFSSGNIGILMAWGNVVSTVIQPWIAAKADQTKRFTLKDFMLLLAALGMIPAVFLVVLPDMMPVIAGLFLLIMIITSILQPLVNAVNGYYVSHGCPMNFGRARGVGSFSYALLSYGMGHLVRLWGADVIPIAIVALLVLFMMVLSSFKMKGHEGQEREKAKEPVKAGGNLFKKYRIFFLFLLGIIPIFAFQNMSNTYLIQIMGQFGGDSSDMGASFAIAAMCEIPSMFLFSKVVRRVKANRLLRIAALGFLMKSVALWMADSVMMIHMAQVLQAFSFAVLIPASVYYSDEVMEGQDRVKGQALITAAITIGGVMGNLTGGKLIDFAGVPAMMLAGIICTGTGMILIWIGAVPPAITRKHVSL